MNRSKSSAASTLFVEALEPRIAPAGLLNEAKFTSVTAGGTILLDASDPNGFQGITTGTGGGSGSYLLYITAGKALVYTTDINGDHQLESNEITGISAGLDSNGKPLDLILFTDLHGDIVTNLLPGKGVNAVTDSDGIAPNGNDGKLLVPNVGIHSVTLRSLTANDIDSSIPGNTVANRLALTNYSIYGNIYTSGDFGGTDAGAGLTVDTSGVTALTQKFNGFNSTQLFSGTVHPYIEGIYTGTAASNQHFSLTQNAGPNTQGDIAPYQMAAGQHGGDINGVHGATTSDLFDIDVLSTGAGGAGARGGNIDNVVLHGDRGGYQVLTGDGGAGPAGGHGGNIDAFNDLGTVTSQVIVHTGAGGAGFFGKGGDAGTATFATSALAANVQIYLGRGGDGTAGGGAGTGLTDATFAVPEGQVPNGGTVLGTYHDIGDIGTQQYLGIGRTGNGVSAPRVIDFDGDGNGDVLFTTTAPDQIVLMFGDGQGGFADTTGGSLSGVSKTVYLDAPGVVFKSVVVADVNGDGRPDVIAASTDASDAGGIYVFLNQIGDNVHNPVGGSLYTHNPLGDHPFSSPFISPLPQLGNFIGNTSGSAFYDSTHPVVALTAGDFNGDGIMDVGYVAKYTTPTTAGPGDVVNVLGVMYGHAATDSITGALIVHRVDNADRPAGTGYFYANSQTDTNLAPILQDKVIKGGDNANYILRASAQVRTNPGTTAIGPEVLFYANSGTNSMSAYQTSTLGITAVSSIVPGQVDTNRGADTTLATASILDYAIADTNNDGVADISILSETPGGFVVTLQGTSGAGALGAANTYVVTSGTANQAGIIVTDNGLVGTTILNIQPIDFNGDGVFNEIALLDFFGTPPKVHIREYQLPTVAGSSDPILLNGSVPLATPTADQAIHAFSPVYQTTAPTSGQSALVTGYGVLAANTGDYRYAQIEFASGITSASVVFGIGTRYETDNGIRVFGGAGGTSSAGTGGAGGSLGNALTAGADGTPQGSLQVIFPAYPSYNGEAAFVGGNGGDGFGGGGNGGTVKGVSTRYTATATIIDSRASLVGGNGGSGIIGNGGNGGSLSQFSLASGRDFLAGNAGNGVVGGTGGSVIGNGTNGALADVTAFDYVTVIAGRGGVGSAQGGTGGSIDTVRPLFVGFGPLTYVAGAGGASASGAGGNGGTIVNASPDPNQNDLGAGGVSGEGITLITGSGGNGQTGGTGGALTNFVSQSTSATGIPSTLDAVTGAGGIGISGAGGAGGAINNLQANGSGLGTSVATTTALVRVIAGAGGVSFGGAGGAGGAISNSMVTAVSSPIIVAAGAGGNGLTSGGVGGSANNNTINSAALTLGKVLVIAGAGGDATASLPTDIAVPGDGDHTDLAHTLLAFGGVSGSGGDGGNITRLTQPTSAQTAVDLIAGNGGSTINYGTATDPKSSVHVGNGGSVDTVVATGTIGAVQRDVNLNYNPPIKSYLDPNGTGLDTGSLTNFVAANFLGTVDTTQTPGARVFLPDSLFTDGTIFSLSNASGNVGIVAGVAGRVRGLGEAGGEAAQGAANGSVQNITASSIMSIVAGSVDRVAPVTLISNLNARNIGGELGADKSLVNGPQFGGPDGLVQYYANPTDANPTATNLQAGYRLFDGALFGLNIVSSSTGAELTGPRIFQTGG